MTLTIQPLTWVPAHGALTVIAWEDERTDIHAVAGRMCGRDTDGLFVAYACACGFETSHQRSDLDASAELISHALHTCVECGQDKPRGWGARCYACGLARALDTPIERICRAARARQQYVIEHPTEFTTNEVAMARNSAHDDMMLTPASVLRYGD